MTPRDALSRTLAAVTNTARCAGCARRGERLEDAEKALADQIHANGAYLAAIAKRDRQIADLKARIKEGKDREAALTRIIVTLLWRRAPELHAARKLSAVTEPADAGGGEAA